MSASHRIPVDLVTGFLGSGKTTLINAVLRDPAFAGAMVVVNEFGEVGLDHLLMSTADDQVLLLDSGCLCCAMSGSLRDTLIDLFARRSSGDVASFNRIIVETSGLAHPGPLVASLLGDSALTPRCALAQVLTLVDAANGMATIARYTEAQRQVAFADRLLISKTDTADAEQLAQLRVALAGLNAHASIEQWQRGEPPAPHFAPLPQAPHARDTADRPEHFLRGPLRPQYGDDSAAADIHGSAFGQVSTHVLVIPQTVDWATYAAWTQALVGRFGKRLLRCKGLLALGDDGAPWVVQGVQGYFAAPERLAAWPGSVPHGFLVCIGEAITRDELDAVVTASPPLH
ncbi:MAG: GTP-binding protein [Rhizobacter sp.]|nr:GTP-binding protein [Rhizobacter sp.]